MKRSLAVFALLCLLTLTACSSGPKVEAEPSDVDVDPYAVTDEPSNVEVEPYAVTDEPSNVEVEPYAVTDEPSNMEVEPYAVTDKPSNVEVEPYAVTDEPSNVEVKPYAVTDEPSDVDVDPYVVTDGGDSTEQTVTMTVVEGTAYPGQVTVIVLNTTDVEIDSGNAADFYLQVEQDGLWYDLKMKDGERVNTAEAYIYEKNVPRELTFQWAGVYGSLEPGHYRVCKGFFEFHEEETEQDKRIVQFTLAAEFTIT